MHLVEGGRWDSDLTMGDVTKIQWTDHTFQSWIGCTKVSPACDHCYAEAMAKRAGWDVWGDDKPRRMMSETYWKQPFKWNREAERRGVPAKVFCASLSDVFEDRVELVPVRSRLSHVVEETPWLIWQFLTKRPENMVRLAPDRWSGGWPSNVWAGTTAETQEYLELRLAHLKKVPARVRFLSLEPLLGPMQLFGSPDDTGQFAPGWIATGVKTWTEYGWEYDVDLQQGVDWVIVGGESGGKARPFALEWAAGVVKQCRGAHVPCFVKQFGDSPRTSEQGAFVKLRTRKGGDPAEWPPGDWPRQFPEVHP